METDGAVGEGLAFLEHFRDLPDPRQPGKVMYPLDEVLLLCLLAVLAGAEAFTDIARFGVKKLDLRRRFRPFRDGPPAYDHLGDIFATLDAETFQQCFEAWVAALTGVPADVIALDGKTVRRSGDNKRGKAVIHMVSAFAARQRLVLGQVNVVEKANEIVAIPRLWDLMSIEGAVVPSTPWAASATSPRKSPTRRRITSSPSRATRARCARTATCSWRSRRPTASRIRRSARTRPSMAIMVASKPARRP